jgi:hypothetical protein
MLRRGPRRRLSQRRLRPSLPHGLRLPLWLWPHPLRPRLFQPVRSPAELFPSQGKLPPSSFRHKFIRPLPLIHRLCQSLPRLLPVLPSRRVTQ